MAYASRPGRRSLSQAGVLPCEPQPLSSPLPSRGATTSSSHITSPFSNLGNKGRSGRSSSILQPLLTRRDRLKLLHPPTMASDSRKAAPEGNSKKLTLYSYWRSSCAQRVRIALNLKVLEYEYKAVNLLKGEQFSPEYEKLNPLHLVPVLVDEGIVVADSFAIILYLEEKYPEHPLLPHDLQKKAINYQVANIVSSSIQPLQNLAVLNYIEESLLADKKLEWAQYHIGRGFAALEKLLESHAGKYATGDEVLLADVFLAPQIYAGAVWFKIDMTPYPILARLLDAYDEIPAFRSARPEMQPDCPSTS